MMKKGLITVLALLTVFAMISCDNGSGTSDNIKITFNLGGAPGTPPKSISIAKGTAIKAAQIPTAPSWDGHTFKGWYNGETKLVDGFSSQVNIVFTAKWSEGSGGLSLTPWKPDEQPEMPTSGYKDYYKDIDFEDWTYTTFAGTGNVGSIEDNGDDTYSVTIKTNPGGVSLLAFVSQEYMFKNGYYVSFNFPEDTDAKPIAAITLATTGSTNDTGQDWNTAFNVNTVSGYVPTNDSVYLAGEIAFARGDLASRNELYKSILLTLVWSDDEEAESYEFTLKKILITTGEDLTPPTFDESWTPDPVTAPTDWIDFSVKTAETTFYPTDTNNKIEAKTNNTYTVTVATRTDGGQSTVTIPLNKANDKYSSGGYYVSVTLPAVSATQPYKVKNFVTTGNGTLWASEIQTSNNPKADATKYVVGKIDNQWGPASAPDEIQKIELALYWIPDTAAGSYTFTINAVKLPDPENIEPPGPSLYTGVVPRVHAYLQETTNWGGTWSNQFDQTNTYSINYTTTLDTATPYDQFLLDLYFPGDAVGKDYQFTLSELKILDSSGNITITEAEILNGSRGGNLGNSYVSQSGVVTKSANGYLVKMTIIKDVDWQGNDSGLGITTLVIPWASTAPVKTYSFKAQLPEPEDQGLENWGGQQSPPTEPTTGVSDFLTVPGLTGPTLTGGKVTVNIGPNWNNTAIVANAVYTVTGKTFDGGFYVLVNVPNNPDAQVIGVMVQGGDGTFNGGIGWAGGRTVEAPAGKYMTGDVAVAWDGTKWDGTPAGAAPAQITIQIIFAPGTASAPYEYTIKKLLVGGLADE